MAYIYDEEGDIIGDDGSDDVGISSSNIDFDYDWTAWDKATNDYLQENYPELVGADTTVLGTLGNALKNLGSSAFNALKGAFTKNGATDWRAVASAAGGLYGLYQGMQGQNQEKVGYQGKIPEYTAVRQQVPVAATPTGIQPRRPGEYGRRYFTDTQYVPKTDTTGIAAANTAATTQANTLSQAQVPTTAIPAPTTTTETQPVNRQTFYNNLMNQTPLASGGIAALKQGRYLKGGTDGMADKIATSIDGTQPAALSHGEFVIPADVVSHLGNGNSEAGAQRLYSMMDRIRKARTGTTKQGKQINPDKHLPV